MIGIWRIDGNSLSPGVEDGEFVVALRFPLLYRLRLGDRVIFRHPQYGVLVKEVKAIDDEHQTVWVEGTQPNSVDSRTFGAIHRKTLLGKVIWHIRKT